MLSPSPCSIIISLRDPDCLAGINSLCSPERVSLIGHPTGKIPNLKSQTPNKLQAKNSKSDAALDSCWSLRFGIFWDLEFVVWDFSGTWSLVLSHLTPL